MLDAASPQSFRRDARVIGLVGVAHSVSHFFQLALPPLFPLLKAEFGVSWTLLGVLVGVFYAASGIAQFAAGFLVDKMGARPVLFGGLALLAGGTLVASFAPGLWWLYPIVALMGLGNGVFHPADFAILNANVDPRRLGHAYSTHGIGGNLGYALAPIVSFGLAALLGWRGSLAVMASVGLVVLGLLAMQRGYLDSHRADASRPQTLRSSVGLFKEAAILWCFLYFIVQTSATVGLQTFAVSALNATFAVPLAIANSAVTTYLLGASAGILLGGFLAVRTDRHDRVAATGLAVAALLVALIAIGPPLVLLLPLFAAIGFVTGATGPSRDLIVRSATPKGASGRVYGFVYSGLDVGATLGPLWFGVMLDHGMGRQMFLAIALLLGIAILTVLQTRRGLVARAAT
ncbi:MAG TPA: MFS transporter [Casimicrobiaceae bacterium]|nr:MFS transporter [Casimicrobiaceae bacterium]